MAVEASTASGAVLAVWVCSQSICRDIQATAALEVATGVGEREQVAVDSLWRALARLQAA